MSKRKQHSPEFKAKVALEALKGVCSGWGQNDTLRPEITWFSICIRP